MNWPLGSSIVRADLDIKYHLLLVVQNISSNLLINRL